MAVVSAVLTQVAHFDERVQSFHDPAIRVQDFSGLPDVGCFHVQFVGRLSHRMSFEQVATGSVGERESGSVVE